MAITGTVELADSVAAEQISSRIVPTAYPRAIMDAFVSAFGGHDYITGSKTKSYVTLGALTAAGLTEGTDMSATAMSDSQRSVTISEHGLSVDYTDLLEIGNSDAEGVVRTKNNIVSAYVDRVESQELALATSFTGQVGVSNSNITLDVLLQAIHELEENDVPAPYFSVLHTAPIHVLRALVGGTSASTGPVFMRPDVLSRIAPAMPNCYAMTQYGVDIFLSRNCPLNSSSVDRVGVMLPMSADYFPVVRLIGKKASGEIWDGRYREQRDESNRLLEMIVTGAWGADLRSLAYGIGIISKAAH